MANSSRKTQRSKNQRNLKLLAMALSGAGLLLLGVVALLLLPKPETTLANNASQASRSAIPVEVNFQAPELNLVDLDGNPVSLADTPGKVILLNNWATWCPPCREEMPALEAYFQAHKDEGFNLVAVEAGQPAGEVQKFASEYELSFPVWLDPDNISLQAFRNSGLPNSYVIDQEGVVRLAWTGAISLENLEKYVTPLLEE